MSIAGKLAAFFLIGAGLLALGAWGVSRWVSRKVAVSHDDDPRLTFPSSFRNVRPEVSYVGDDRCAACHPDQTASFHQHPMGRSFAPVTLAPAIERYGPEAHNPFDFFELRFAVERRGGRILHKEMQPGPPGSAGIAFEAEVQFALGSGERGRSYLINHDGYLFQSIISWFTQAASWNLSPGLEAHPHSERRVMLDCLFCHCNSVEAVPDTSNRFQEPIFRRGYAIGCERCHGPGELHARLREEGEPVDEDDTIVNPARLSATLREAVCQQCHLQGQTRILRRGRHPFDFRPGLPLSLFWSVFVQAPDLQGTSRAVGQVEQMYASRCFRASEGRLGCTSCHDPHAVPPSETKVAFYRQRCLGCHTESACRETRVARQQAGGDDCTACHMPRLASSDVAHTALRDHRVLRRPPKPGTRPPLSDTDDLPPALFQSDPEVSGDRGSDRDLALALFQRAEGNAGNRRTLWLGLEKAGTLLETTVRDDPEDMIAWEGLGKVRRWLGRKEAALAAVEKALSLAPQREETLVALARLTTEMDRHAEARTAWTKVLAVNPWFADYHYELQKLLVQDKDWQAAAEQGRAVQRLNPFVPEAQALLVETYLAMGRREDARAECAKLRVLSPAKAEELSKKINH
jgi:predicted CXXCH cytochrome family protein